LALLVSLRDLIEMMSIGTLLAYTLVSVCVLLLRYQPDEQTDTHQFRVEEDEASLLKRLLGARPTPATGRIVTRCTLLFFITSFFLWSTVIYGVEQGSGVGAVFSGLMATLMAASLVKLMVLILQQPESTRRLPYMAPCVPFVPGAAILVNSYLMLKLSPLTWARFTIWCIIGLLIYGCYGVWHSTLELNKPSDPFFSWINLCKPLKSPVTTI
uniref:Solute carrier family 7 member 14b n=1 Tax=Oryzias sinensis TaxID=183150 RepID=A0A8C7X9X4_9TELE